MDRLRDIFSFSKLDCFSRCPRRFFNKYVARLSEPPSAAMLFGRAAHKGQEIDNLEKEKGRVLSLVQVLDAAVAEFEAGEGEDVDKFAQEHRQQLEAYEKSGERDRVWPVKGTIEAPFELEIAVTHDPDEAEPEPAIIQGFVDVVSEDRDTGEQTICDYKCVGRPVSQRDSDASLQGALYALANDAPRYRFISFVTAKNQYPTSRMVESSLDQDKVTRLLHYIADTVAGIRRALRTGDFPKASPSCFWCSPEACPFYTSHCYPKRDASLTRFISIGESRKAGTLPQPEWRKGR